MVMMMAGAGCRFNPIEPLVNMKLLWGGQIRRGSMTPKTGILTQQSAGCLRCKGMQLRCWEPLGASNRAAASSRERLVQRNLPFKRAPVLVAMVIPEMIVERGAAKSVDRTSNAWRDFH